MTTTSWRGGVPNNPAVDIEQDHGGRILLLLSPGKNRELLRHHLAEHHEVIEPDGDVLPRDAFDLVIVDPACFHRWFNQILDAKTREEPTFLPCILVLSRSELKQRLKAFWNAVDEFVVTPLERKEFSERVAMLLRARRLAVMQRSRLAYLVNHDRSTGLPNKTLFMDRLSNVLRDASLLDWNVAVAVVRIPLARILKSLGHEGLERAATACATRLRSLLGDEVSLARLTTEEFGIIHHSRDSLASITDVCSRVQRLADEPLRIGDETVHVSPRMGIALYPEDAEHAGSLLDCAISALSEVKEDGPAFYSREVRHEALRFIRTEARLHEALAQNQFELWFQPQINLLTRAVIGVEALVRWRLPGGKLVPPGEFIGVAEASGLIGEIDRWVLQKSCATMQQWKTEGVDVQRIAVNVSAEDVNAPDFNSMIERMLATYSLPPPTLELEITETTLFEISDTNMEKLRSLKAMGVSIAVDDFGTGYSSLSYLHRLPVTTLKIDKAFVDRVDQDHSHAAIARAIVWLAKNFGLETVAEGIESEAQAQKLRGMGVVTGQGFLYARPMPAAELCEWLAQTQTSVSRNG